MLDGLNVAVDTQIRLNILYAVVLIYMYRITTSFCKVQL